MNNEMIKGNKKSKKLYIESLENDVVVRTEKEKENKKIICLFFLKKISKCS